MGVVMVLAAAMLGLILVGVILSNIYGYYRPSWSVMRPVIKEAAAFPHRPPAVAADWRRLQAGHRLTVDQLVAIKRWVNHEREVRDKRLVERLTVYGSSVLACKQTANCTPKHIDNRKN